MNRLARSRETLIAAAFMLATLAAPSLFAADSPQSEWAHPGPDGKLQYKTTPAGDRIMDFSHAGYKGGGVALPDVPVKETVQPSGGDDTPVIQAAINAVAKMPLENGFHGAVLLAPGDFTCSGTLNLAVSGIVLRGSGSGPEGTTTTIHMVGPRHGAIAIGAPRGGGGGGNRKGRNRAQADPDDAPEANQEAEARPQFTSAQTSITTAYVPSGTNAFTVADASGFSVGDTIAIRRPTTPAWVKFMQMDDLSRNGGRQTWIGTNRAGMTERKIASIDGNKFTLDIPLADSYDANYLNPPGVTISKVRPQQRVTNVGVEKLHIQCEPIESSYGRHPYSAIRVGGDDCWVKDVYCEETMNSTVLGGRRITMQNVRVYHTYANLGASKPSDFSIEGSQILLDRCTDRGGNTYFVWTSSLIPGPNVMLNCTFTGKGSHIQPHQRWSTGLLVDNCRILDGRIDFMNRGVMGSGHGWTMGWAVAWNCVAGGYTIQNPPGVMNWAIGCIGKSIPTPRPFDKSPNLPEGTFDSPGKAVAPQSLYLAQLKDRLGEQAVKDLGYASEAEITKLSPSPSPSLGDGQIDATLGPDLALRRPINASARNNNGREFGGEKAVDGDDSTYWATNDISARGSALEVDMEGPVEINALEIREARGLENIQQYRVEGQIDSDWKVMCEGTTIGDKKIHRFEKVKPWKVRLIVTKANGYPAVRTFALYESKEAN